MEVQKELKRIIGLIREKWQDTHIMIRGDSAYSREDIMNWCEDEPRIDYVLAMGTNNQLQLRADNSQILHVVTSLPASKIPPSLLYTNN